MKNLTADEFQKYLKEVGACSDAIEWAKGKSLFESWLKCERSEWMLWYYGRNKPVKKICVEISIFTARLCMDNYESLFPNDDRPRMAIESAEKYVKNPSAKNKKAARSAAFAAWSAAWSAAESAESAANEKICDFIRSKIKVR